jgi:hypothetical protein
MMPAQATLAHVRRILRRAVLGARDLDGALMAGRLLGEVNWWNNDGLLAEEELEEAVHRRHGPALAACAPTAPAAAVEWLHVISEAHAFGGHTRLLAMLLAAQRRTGAEAAVAVTRSAPASFAADVRASGASLIPLAGTPAMRAAELIGYGRSAQRIVLHIHPDDLGAALAARQLRAEGRQVLFVNHADHVFSYGVGAADLCLEVSGFGWRLSEARRPARARHFLGIPVNETECVPPPPRAPGTPTGTVFSMGSYNKYKPGGGYDFPAFVSDLLDRTRTSVEVIGAYPSDPWWAAALERHGGRLQLLGSRPFEETSARLAAAACYVDSFPINGGTAFPQALMAGKTVFGPGADAGGYNLADSLRFPSVQAMSDALCAFLDTGIPLEGEQAIRSRIATEFNADAIAARLLEAVEGRPGLPPPELLASPRALHWYPEMWRAGGQVDVRMRGHKAPLVGLSTRLELALRIAGRPEVRGAPCGRRAMLRWVLKGIS